MYVVSALAALALAVPLGAKPPPPMINISPAPIPVAAPAPPPVSTKTVPRIFLSTDGETVYIVGAIMDDAFLRFDALLQKAPQVKRVYLASPGGLTIEGRLIAALVRKRHLDTYVEHYCASACTQVFVSGRERVLGPEAELGFHQAIAVDDKGETKALTKAGTQRLTPLSVFGINGNDTLRLAYEQAGIDEPFIAKALAKGHDDLWLPGTAELIASHVITRRAAAPELTAPDGSHSREEIAAQADQRSFWRAARQALPAAYAAGLNDAWRRANTGSSVDDAIASGRGAVVVAAWPLLASSSDSMLDRMLALYAGSARVQRAQGYPMCKEEITDEAPHAMNPLDASFESREDALLVELFGKPPGKSLSRKEAEKVFDRDVVPPMLSSYFGTDLKSSTSSCRLGFKIFEAIDDLPTKKRINAYRALLSLPDGGNP
ncbi:MAG: hypothetical protein ACKOQM_10665 [Novosphingobium sp.]